MIQDINDLKPYHGENASAGQGGEPCCSGAEPVDQYRYRDWPFVTKGQAWPDQGGGIPQMSTAITWRDVIGGWAVRWGWRRYHYRIRPGLYAVGKPDQQAPVLVTANYKLTVDALRRELIGLHVWILVLNTKGINVWCAAGKKTFSTAEIVQRVRATGLERIVSHRQLIVPQLGASGVSAHQVKNNCGFSVRYGPVRAKDIKLFLAKGMQADPDMRQVLFTFWDRLVLVPVEVTGMLKPSLWILASLLVLAGFGPGGWSMSAVGQRGLEAFLVYLAGLGAGAVLFPILLPWIPGRAFSLKGAVVGLGLAFFLLGSVWASWLTLMKTAIALAVPAVSAICAMNFTGASTYTSPSGVAHEMRRAMPLQGAALLVALIAWVASAFVKQ